jgi:hypothetical protein
MYPEVPPQKQKKPKTEGYHKSKEPANTSIDLE